jgi:exodeoxyribonuclease VII large subunit
MLLNEMENRMALSMKHIISGKKEDFLSLPDITMIEKNLVSRLRHRFAMQVQAIHNLSPLAVMSRGYSIVTDKDDKIIKSVENINEGDKLHIRLNDGRVKADVKSVIREK